REGGGGNERSSASTRAIAPGGLLRGLGVLLLLSDTRRLAAPAAQVIELRATHLAAAHDLDRVDQRRVEREHALDALTVGDLAHREALIDAAARARDAHALIGLHAGALAFDHLHVDDQRVARPEVGDFLVGGQFGDLLLLELL